MSGAREAGMRIANIPSDKIVRRRKRVDAMAGTVRTTPAPTTPSKDLCRDVGTDKGVDNEGHGDHRRDKTPPFEGGDIGDDDLGQELETTGLWRVG